MYRIIVLILFTAFFFTGCRQKKPDPKFLTDTTVVRKTEEEKNAEKTPRQEERFSQTGENGADRYESERASGGQTYYVIVSSGTNRKGADRMVVELKKLGYMDAEVLDELGQLRVSIARYKNRKEAIDMRDHIREITDLPKIWVLLK